ncbi:discoidin domain-containing protein [Paenibacillus sp. N1-5-1-14]|uniref:discoidin domain-containing protein n=1 Tax=Paenibacillus radicibacter TaxID=2972488 RepID=UPI002158F4D4|nr:discoidin domain-containing protein [Paenibacillus radicibacter]MCR8641566.1 discoidin domain-containing protein [Paenibacillus radicibacter]
MAIVTDLSKMNIGDKIICSYVATSNAIGAFSELGTSIKPPIPPTSSTTPNGSFYFIYVDNDHLGRKILIADRDVQIGISWDTLNTSGISSGSGLPISIDKIEKKQLTIRIPTGGVSEFDTDNEWDNYILNSTLDKDMWIWTNTNRVSWSSSTINGKQKTDLRMTRGSKTLNTYGWTDTKDTGLYMGFRPVLLYETLLLHKTFILMNGEYKKWINGVSESGGYFAKNSIPIMTSNTTPSGIASASSSYNTIFYDSWVAFDNSTAYGWLSANGQTTGWVTYEFTTAKKIDAYRVKSTGTVVSIELNAHPKDWTFEGTNDGTNWVVLDIQKEQSFLSPSEIKSFIIPNPNFYKKYRINITLNNGHARYVGFGDLEMYENTPYIPATPPSWKTISTTLPSVDTFKSDGMDDLSLLDRKLTNFTFPMDDNGAAGQASGKGKLFKENIDLKRFIDIKTISVK